MSGAEGGPEVGFDPVLRIGVTGHRRLADAAAVARASRRIFAAVVEEIEAVNPLLPRPASLRIVSPLAEGADRVVAEAALDAGAKLQAPLPFSREAYEGDFSDESTAAFRQLLDRAERVLELNGEREREAAAYEAVGRVVLGHSDILIAVWDGHAPKGRGGTGQIVEEALTIGVPVIWLRPDGVAEPEVLLSSVQRQQSVSLDALKPVIRSILAIPLRPEDEGTTLETFIAERRPAWTLGGLFVLFRNLVLGKLNVPPVRTERWLESADRRWREELQALDPAVAKPLHDWLQPIYTWADELANYYGGLYRSVFLANFLLSVFGAAVGLSTVFMGVWTAENAIWGVGATATEIACAGIIVGLSILARRRGWHGRWIDYREMAERLRPLRFIYLLGSGARREPEDEQHRKADAWIDWIVPDIERSLGLPNAKMTPEYLGCVRRFLLAEIDGQIGYHATNAFRMETVERRLGKFGELMFWLVLLFGVVSLSLNFLPDLPSWRPGVTAEELASPVFSFFGVVLPALGAALFGVRALGEFSRLAKRSAGTAEALRRHRDAIAATADNQLTREALCSAADTAARLMMSDTADWRTLVVMRPIDMPG